MHIKEEECKIIEDKLHSQIGPNFLNNFDEKRKNGVNNSYICQMIRQDSVEDFISYVNRRNISLSSKIPNSIFETNRLFLKKNPTLIEYAAFYGSIKIFQYLQFNKVELDSSLWIYVIHSKNPELIHLLEENHINSTDSFYDECLHEAIKCHQNEIAQYIVDNLLDESYESLLVQRHFFKNILSYSFHYYNYSFIPIEFNNKFIFYYLCKYNYIKLVKLFLNNNKVDLNLSIIPSSVTSIANSAFKGCFSLEKISIPSSVTEIGFDAFSGCELLTLMSIPSNLDRNIIGIDSNVKITTYEV